MTHYAKVNAAFKIGAILDLYCHGRVFAVYHHVKAVARQEFHLRLRPDAVKPLLDFSGLSFTHNFSFL